MRGLEGAFTLLCLPLSSGTHNEPIEVGMRLAPGERQSGDGTSLPETPNLNNVGINSLHPITVPTQGS